MLIRGQKGTTEPSEIQVQDSSQLTGRRGPPQGS